METFIDKTAGQQILDDTLSLARVIADLCITSNLKSSSAVHCALDIAGRLVDANESEGDAIMSIIPQPFGAPSSWSQK